MPKYVLKIHDASTGEVEEQIIFASSVAVDQATGALIFMDANHILSAAERNWVSITAVEREEIKQSESPDMSFEGDGA